MHAETEVLMATKRWACCQDSFTDADYTLNMNSSAVYDQNRFYIITSHS